MDFDFTEEQKMIRSVAREFARKEIAPHAEYYDRTGEFPHEIQRKARELGLINVIIPEEYGGSGLSAIEMIIVGEELAWGCAGIAVGGIAINTLAAQPILLAGDSGQKKKYLGILSQGYGRTAYPNRTRARTSPPCARAPASSKTGTYSAVRKPGYPTRVRRLIS